MKLDTTFSAIADPTRRGILELLADGDLPVGDLVERFPISQSAVSRHLQVLEHAGLVTRRRVGKQRFCQLNGAPLNDAIDWVATYRKRWEDRFDRLERLLADDGKTENT